MTSIEEATKLFSDRFCADDLRDPKQVVAVGCNHEGIIVYISDGHIWKWAVETNWMDQFPKKFKGHPVKFEPMGRLKPV